jgi:hypothetical protein
MLFLVKLDLVINNVLSKVKNVFSKEGVLFNLSLCGLSSRGLQSRG